MPTTPGLGKAGGQCEMKVLDLENVGVRMCACKGGGAVSMVYRTRADYLVEGQRAKIRVSLFTKYSL